MSKIDKAYYYNEKLNKFSENYYDLEQFKKLEESSDPKSQELFNRLRRSIYCEPKYLNGVADEKYKISYHGKSKKEFHHLSNKTHFFICDEFDSGHDETPEHKNIKDIIYDIAKNDGIFKVIVNNERYELDIEKVLKESYVELKLYIFKPDIVLKLKHNENNNLFIERYSDTIYLEICNTHPNSKKKIDAFQFENKFLVQLNVNNNYYRMTNSNKNDYYAKKRKQLMDNYVSVEVHSNELKDRMEFKVTDDNGITYYLSVKDKENIHVGYKEDGLWTEKTNYKGKKFTVETAWLYILYRIRLSRD